MSFLSSKMALITFPRVLLSVGILSLALAAWSLIQAEIWDAVFGLGLGVLLLLYWRWALGRRNDNIEAS
jgi:hypothetical protein